MTRKKFLEELGKTPYKWKLLYGAMIRTDDDNEFSPILAVQHSTLGKGTKNSDLLVLAASSLGLSDTDIDKIVDASDIPTESELRKKLLEICDLVE